MSGRILVLAYHEPTLDPRVHYTAESLAKKHAVTVLATVQGSEARPPDNQQPRSYETIRVPYRKQGAVAMGYAFLRLWVTAALGERLGAIVAAPVAFVLLLAVAVLAATVVAFGAVLELALLPFMAATGQRPSLVLPLLRALKRMGRVASSWLRTEPRSASRLDASGSETEQQRPKGRAERVITGSLEKPTKGIRVTLSVLRFTLSTTAVLWRHAVGQGQRPAIVYCHDLYSLQAGVMLKRRYGARLIYDSHEYYPYQYQFWCFSPIIKIYEAVLVRSVDVYLTISPQLAAELSRVYRVSPVHALPNVEPCPVLRTEPRETEMSRLANGRLILLYQGTFAEGRGLEEVIAEWRAIDPGKIALFLRGPRNPWLGHLERLADELGLLGKSIYVLAPVLEKDLIAAAQEADIGLIPYKTDWLSYRFACPNKLSQYLHAGLAILSNRIAYVEQIVRDGDVGVCYDAGRGGSFAAAVGGLSENRPRVEAFKRNALAFAEREYNWGRFENRLLGLVDDA